MSKFMNDFVKDILSDKKKKYGAIAIIVVVVLCILFGIHEANKPISPVVGTWTGNKINLDRSMTGHANAIKLSIYNNHTFKMHDDQGDGDFEGNTSGKWAKTNDVDDNGNPIYVLKFTSVDLNDDGEYFTLGGKNNVLWVGPSDNQQVNLRLNRTN